MNNEILDRFAKHEPKAKGAAIGSLIIGILSGVTCLLYALQNEAVSSLHAIGSTCGIFGYFYWSNDYRIKMEIIRELQDLKASLKS